ncbi:zinc-dependent alcohol dehydrogenase [Solimonas terrae]|uniref:Alcohol dehydrogenase catalytic domain-containing protein n=1 Tax=Solimonas terrae TaxID=1396819 RepID=A0A6M2BNB9_9GAMM|nr:alcohol dehydrogenase catalytic domain-containing protein [Solimonas terrae]NGY03948.1 alcohol dehydrogenase catalytic domain-containing protein [Solimonas terrae]
MGHVLNIHEVNDFRLDAYQRPEPGAGDVVVKVKACGVCGSDLTYIKLGGIHRKPGGVTPLGHEAAGEVMYVGKDVEHLGVGQRVIINPMMTPSYIGSGGPEGAFTEELLVRGGKLGESLLPIPDGLPYDIAAMTEPLAVALHGVNRMQLKPGDKAVVFGCGPIGLGMVLWLVDRGVTDVVALDLAPERLERARALGARAAFDPTREDLRARLVELHGTGRVFSRETVGTDAFIDAAGAPNILSDVVRMAKFQSRMVITAAHSKPVPLDLGAMLTTEMTITTAVGYPTEMPDVIAALPRLRDKIGSLISHRFPFARVIDAFDAAATPQSAKVMVEFDGAGA